MDGLRKAVHAWWQVPLPGEHKASPLLWTDYECRGGHSGKGTFLSLRPEISLYVSFSNTVSDGQVLGHPLKKNAVCLPFFTLSTAFTIRQMN
jgi:hypothetical protein